MRTSDRINLCIKNLLRRKFRTILTMTGVVIGVCSIVVMISIGIGLQKASEDSIAQMGDLTRIDVYNYTYSSSSDNAKIDDSVVAQFSVIPGVELATPMYSPNIDGNLFSGKKDRYQCWPQIVGIYPEALELLGYNLVEGRSFGDNDKEFSVIIGEHSDYDFYDTKARNDGHVWYEEDENGDPVNDPYVDMMKDDIYFKVNTNDKGKSDKYSVQLNVIGRLEQDWSKGYETYSGIFMRISDVKKLEEIYRKASGTKKDDKDSGYQHVIVKVTDINTVASVQEQIEDMGYDCSSLESIRKPMQEQARKIQIILGGIGAVSLLVAAIGIVNTMVMSIYERTREIGIMKVLGCTIGNIRSIFLIEAGAIGIMGGIVGLGISFAISYIINHFAGGLVGYDTTISVITPFLAVFAIVFATFVGLLAGYYPANRAAKIAAIEAIRRE